MLWILIAAAVCAGDLLVKHYMAIFIGGILTAIGEIKESF